MENNNHKFKIFQVVFFIAVTLAGLIYLYVAPEKPPEEKGSGMAAFADTGNVSSDVEKVTSLKETAESEQTDSEATDSTEQAEPVKPEAAKQETEEAPALTDEKQSAEDQQNTEAAAQVESENIGTFVVENSDHTGINVRAEASGKGQVLGELKYGSTGSVLAEDGYWLLIQTEEFKGYVSAAYVNFTRSE